MANRGIAPPELDTPVGQFRLAVDDLTYVELDPAEIGYGDYTLLSDDQIEALVTMADDSVLRGVGLYYTRLAAKAAEKARMVKDYDLQVDLRTQYKALLEMAQWWYDRADATDLADGGLDIFEVFDTPGGEDSRRPEASPGWIVY